MRTSWIGQCLLLLVVVAAPVQGWSFGLPTDTDVASIKGATTGRRQWLGKTAAAFLLGVGGESLKVHAMDYPTTRLNDTELEQAIIHDVQDNQFMVTADLTKSLYEDTATFTDEIDTYEMNAWIRGTKRLFVADQSHVDLIPDTLQVSDSKIEYRFEEDLTFNLPLVKPKVHLTGRVELQRNPKTGLISSYREFWDQSIKTVITSAQWNK